MPNRIEPRRGFIDNTFLEPVVLGTEHGVTVPEFAGAAERPPNRATNIESPDSSLGGAINWAETVDATLRSAGIEYDSASGTEVIYTGVGGGSTTLNIPTTGYNIDVNSNRNMGEPRYNSIRVSDVIVAEAISFEGTPLSEVITNLKAQMAELELIKADVVRLKNFYEDLIDKELEST